MAEEAPGMAAGLVLLEGLVAVVAVPGGQADLAVGSARAPVYSVYCVHQLYLLCTCCKISGQHRI